jgi:cytochrome c oxidase assembly factor 6
MGLFSSSTTPEPTPDLTKKSARKVCWESRDKYFACLDKHNILDPRLDPATALAKCKSEDAEFNRDCVKSWVRRSCPWLYFFRNANFFFFIGHVF